MKYGTVTFFNNNPQKYFGFLQDEDGDVFFHWNNGRQASRDGEVWYLPKLTVKGLTRTPIKGDEIVFWDEESPDGKGRRAKIWAFRDNYEAWLYAPLIPRPGSRDGIVAPEEVVEVLGEDPTLVLLMAMAAESLKLTNAEVGIFVRHTPAGKRGNELYEEYERRCNEQLPGEYTFATFVRETLAAAGHPWKGPAQ